ncbi:uncharacterized mitochondrial protein AtMg00810-like [Nicotiana sylvestris]|uniref:uncharacterized mitochondrial protein AtMg00810-like n=1 Tax=Nicotiana sylvestris TaxID=4096 RepID=UPI00388CCD59
MKADVGTLLLDPTYYRKLVGKLNFLTNTRLDIAYNMYLKTDPTLGIFFSNSTYCSIYAYCDSDWAFYPDSRRSVTSYIVLVGDSPISWKPKKQETISLSSANAEYRSLRKVVGELLANFSYAQYSAVNKFLEEAYPYGTPA